MIFKDRNINFIGLFLNSEEYSCGYKNYKIWQMIDQNQKYSRFDRRSKYR